MKEDGATIRDVVRKIVRETGGDRAALLPALQQVQARLGYLPGEAMREVAASLGIAPVEVYSVATFYNQFRLNPPGKHSIRVCLGTACHMKGGYVSAEAWERRLGIKRGETTADREFDLDTVACVGCCTMAPVSVVDDVVNAKVTPTRVDGILNGLRKERA